MSFLINNVVLTCLLHAGRKTEREREGGKCERGIEEEKDREELGRAVVVVVVVVVGGGGGGHIKRERDRGRR